MSPLAPLGRYAAAGAIVLSGFVAFTGTAHAASAANPVQVIELQPKTVASTPTPSTGSANTLSGSSNTGTGSAQSTPSTAATSSTTADTSAAASTGSTSDDSLATTTTTTSTTIAQGDGTGDTAADQQPAALASTGFNSVQIAGFGMILVALGLGALACTDALSRVERMLVAITPSKSNR